MTELIVMRLANMKRVHPEQIEARCSKCGEAVGVYPSGRRVMESMADVVLVCQVCMKPGAVQVLAPGAELEPFQSKRRS